LAVVAGGVYFLGKSNKNEPAKVVSQPAPQIVKSQSTPTPESTSAASPATTGAGDMTSWKIYKSKNFEFQYPPNGMVLNESSSIVYISYKDGTKPYWTFTINLSDNTVHLTTKQFVDKIINDLRNKNVPGAKSQADQMQQTMKEYTNGQIAGIKLQTFDEGYPQKFGKVVEATNNQIYEFSIGDGSGGGVSDNDEKRLDQILSTFKFIP